MSYIFGKKWRLKPSILTLFVVLTVPVSLTIIAVTYFSNDRIAREDASALVDRFSTEAIANIQGDINPIKSLIRSVAALGNIYPGIYDDDRSIDYFQAVLVHSRKIVSVYIGLENGSFRQARRIDPAVEIQGKLPPDGAIYASRVVERSKDHAKESPTLDRYVFLDASEKDVGSFSLDTTYDPRTRGWYRSASQTGSIMITEPDVFAALGLIGFTVAAPFRTDGKVSGVAAADITLDGLSQYLAERKISPGALSYILDQQGRVIAASDLSRTYANENGRVSLRHISSLDNGLPAAAFGARPRGTEKLYSFDRNGQEFVARLSAFAPELGTRWQLFVVAPISDFTGDFEANNKRLLAFGLAALCLQVVIIYFLTGAISSPLERLAAKVGVIQDLSDKDLPTVVSPIREISVLSRAIDTLDSTIKSFASFVPVGLVTQLLHSDQKLELGGHSRFLTIFFSDIEAFSTLSEEVPAQELLLRVSKYLEIVTRAVNHEAGTIDKFIGDGVMAFWGAPALLDDHALRACLSALRIQRDMDALNAQWREQGTKPMRVRIGIHSDAVLVGNIGSKERMSYTVMGDGVNIAARLEGTNKEYGTRICIGHSVYKETGENLCVRPIDDVTVKGRRSKIPVYELMGAFGVEPELEPDARTIELCRLTRLAYETAGTGDFALAVERYNRILVDYPGDPVASEMSKRLVAIVSADAARSRGPLARL
jgi:adenylate cyclase